MKYIGLFLIIFGTMILVFPDFLEILVGSFFIIIGINLAFIGFQFGKMKSKGKKEDYVKFGNYKIFR